MLEILSEPRAAKAGATVLGLQLSQGFSYKIARPAFWVAFALGKTGVVQL